MLRYALLLFPLLSLGLLSSLTGCAINPATGEQDFVLMSESQEIATGKQIHAQILENLPLVSNNTLQDYVNDIGQRVAQNSHRPELEYVFTVLDSNDVNAFALPGGYIYITRGLLAYLNSEAELAAVLGHEIAHVTARHAVRGHALSTATSLLSVVAAVKTGTQDGFRLAGLLNNALVAGYGRSLELEADHYGAEYMARVNYNPSEMLNVLGFLKHQETFEVERARLENRKPRIYHGVFATHPDNDERLQEAVAAAPNVDNSIVARESYLRQLQNLAFGSSTAEGVHKFVTINGQRQERFLHQDLQFHFVVPDEYQLINLPDRIILTLAKPDRTEALRRFDVLEIMSKPLPENHTLTPERYVREIMKLDNLSEGATINNPDGLPAWGGISITGPFFDRSTQWVSVVFVHDRAYTIVTPLNYATPELITGAKSVLASFSVLQEPQKDLAKAMQLAIIKMPFDMSYAQLAADSPIPDYAEQQLRLLNGHYPDGEPTAEQLIKIVR